MGSNTVATRESRYRALVHSVPDSILAVFDRDLLLVFADGGGIDENAPGFLPGTHLAELVPAERRGEVLAAAHEALAGVKRSVEFRDAPGRRVWSVDLAPFRNDDDDGLEGIIWVARDVSAYKAAEEQLSHQALHDSLTGLANRQLFMDRLQQALARLARASSQLAVIFIDLDRLKLVNDKLGHGAGDEVLAHAARRLRRVIRPSDTLARFGGDEFVAVCESIENEAEVERIARRLGAVLMRPLDVDGTEIRLTASMGIRLESNAHADPAALVRDADTAMYRAKDRGRATFQFFDETMRLQAVERLRVENDLRWALAHNELSMLYQPQVRMADYKIVGAEALLRWRHPDRGLIAPVDFIGIAEESGLIVPIGYWVMAEVCGELASWPEDLGVSINLSPHQLWDPDLISRAAAILQKTGTDPRRVCLEVAENALFTDAERAVETLSALRKLGFRLAIDDFGVGFSSLYHLRQLPDVDQLKLDRAFVADLGKNDRDAVIVASVVLLTNSLGMEALGEGVETAEQADQLRTMGCDYGQGFLFGAPVPAEEFLARVGR